MFHWASVLRLPLHLGELQNYGKSRADGRSRLSGAESELRCPHSAPASRDTPSFPPWQGFKGRTLIYKALPDNFFPGPSSLSPEVGQGRHPGALSRAGAAGIFRNASELCARPPWRSPCLPWLDGASALSVTHFLPIHPSLFRPARHLLACCVPQLLLPRASGGGILWVFFPFPRGFALSNKESVFPGNPPPAAEHLSPELSEEQQAEARRAPASTSLEDTGIFPFFRFIPLSPLPF